jgi:hypothetical protein
MSTDNASEFIPNWEQFDGGVEVKLERLNDHPKLSLSLKHNIIRMLMHDVVAIRIRDSEGSTQTYERLAEISFFRHTEAEFIGLYAWPNSPTTPAFVLRRCLWKDPGDVFAKDNLGLIGKTVIVRPELLTKQECKFIDEYDGIVSILRSRLSGPLHSDASGGVCCNFFYIDSFGCCEGMFRRLDVIEAKKMVADLTGLYDRLSALETTKPASNYEVKMRYKPGISEQMRRLNTRVTDGV